MYDYKNVPNTSLPELFVYAVGAKLPSGSPPAIDEH